MKAALQAAHAAVAGSSDTASAKDDEWYSSEIRSKPGRAAHEGGRQSTGRSSGRRSDQPKKDVATASERGKTAGRETGSKRKRGESDVTSTSRTRSSGDAGSAARKQDKGKEKVVDADPDAEGADCDDVMAAQDDGSDGIDEAIQRGVNADARAGSPRAGSDNGTRGEGKEAPRKRARVLQPTITGKGRPVPVELRPDQHASHDGGIDGADGHGQTLGPEYYDVPSEGDEDEEEAEGEGDGDERRRVSLLGDDEERPRRSRSLTHHDGRTENSGVGSGSNPPSSDLDQWRSDPRNWVDEGIARDQEETEALAQDIIAGTRPRVRRRKVGGHETQEEETVVASGTLSNDRRARNGRPDAQQSLGSTPSSQTACVVRINIPSTLLHLLTVIGDTLVKIPLRVQSTPRFKGISVSGVDEDQICAIYAYLFAGVQVSEGCKPSDLENYVEIDMLKMALGSVTKTSWLKMERKVSDSRLYFACYEGNTLAEDLSFSMPVLDDFPVDSHMEPMEHLYHFEVDLDMMKRLLQLALKGNATDVGFVVKASRNGSPRCLLQIVIKGPQINFCRNIRAAQFSVDLLSKEELVHRNADRMDDDDDDDDDGGGGGGGDGYAGEADDYGDDMGVGCRSRRARGGDGASGSTAAASAAGTRTRTEALKNMLHSLTTQFGALDPVSIEREFEEVYNESFNTRYLAMFLKSMKRHTLMISLSPGLPMVINYPLADDGSKILFVMMHVMKTDEEDAQDVTQTGRDSSSGGDGGFDDAGDSGEGDGCDASGDDGGCGEADANGEGGDDDGAFDGRDDPGDDIADAEGDADMDVNVDVGFDVDVGELNGDGGGDATGVESTDGTEAGGEDEGV